jgi:hypothetical protein
VTAALYVIDWPVTEDPGADVAEFAPLVEVNTTVVASALTAWVMLPETAEAE